MRYLNGPLYPELSGPDVSINELKIADVIKQNFKKYWGRGSRATANCEAPTDLTLGACYCLPTFTRTETIHLTRSYLYFCSTKPQSVKSPFLEDASVT